MLLYGDPRFDVEARAVTEKFQALIRSLPPEGNVDAARDLLIGCGQLEQGLADGGLPTAQAERLTELAARLFISSQMRVQSSRLISHLNEILDCLSEQSIKITIKLPEGYAFYTVFPEQYIAAVKQWMEQNRPGPVLVVGIRSIGTSLSALIKVVLNESGYLAERITVRPSGSPYARTCGLPENARNYSRLLVVDEGPGQSGSSMASVATAGRELGIERIDFFPAHDNGPGPSASPQIREIWKACPRWTISIKDALWKGTQPQKLAERSAALLGTENLKFHDLSGGGWRNFLLLDGKSVPSDGVLERSKYLFLAPSGEGVLWKFAGIGFGPSLDRLAARSLHSQQSFYREGFAAALLEIVEGFVGMRWVRGRTLEAADLDERTIKLLARYIAVSARVSNLRVGAEDFPRMKKMTAFNLSEAFGDASLQALTGCFQESDLSAMPAYGDGRMSPHEWIQTDHGKLLKADCWGHHLDHTLIGNQPFLWDVAGAVVEWKMERTQRERFTEALRIENLAFEPALLDFFVLAYVAFRLGVASFVSEANLAVEGYRETARNLLDSTLRRDFNLRV
jgi:hypothetical protein